jgi:hypothetical protein
MTEFIFTAVEHTQLLLWVCVPINHAVAQGASHQHIATDTWDQSQLIHVGFMMEKVSMEEIYSKYFSFSCPLSFQQCSILLVYHHVPVL